MKGTSSLTSINNDPLTSNGPHDQLPSFEYEPLGRVVFGAGQLARLGELVRSVGSFRHVLLVSDPGLAQVGHPQRAQAILSEAGYEVRLYDEVRENPTDRQVQRGVEVARAHKTECLIALGGGSAMDCAKGINFLLTNGGQMRDYKGHGKATRPMLPSIGIPTTSGTGSEAQSYALITDESTHMKMACGDKKAAFRLSILDPALTVSQPRMVTAVTGIDALAHAIESYVCTKRTPFSQLAAKSAFERLSQNLPVVLKHPDHLAARGEMQLGAYLAGTSIEQSMLGICHSCANPLTAHYGLTHGLAIGVLLPHVIRFNAERNPGLYASLAPSAGALAEFVQDCVTLAGLPTRLKDCGVSDAILPLLAEEANQQWTARFNPRPVSETELLAVYQSAW